MIQLRTPLTLLILLITVGFAHLVRADELKEISQLLSQGQQAQALERVNSYVAAKPNDVSGQFLKGVVLAEMSKSAEAIKIFSSIVEKHPELPEPYNNLAVLYAEQGQYDKSRQALEKAIKTHPSYATAHENLGDIYAKMASDAYDKALQLDRSNSRAQTKLSMIKELFANGSITPPASSAKPEEPVKAPAQLPAVSPTQVAAVVPAPPVAEPSKAIPNEPKGKPSQIQKEKEKPAIVQKEEPKVDENQAVLDAVNTWAKAWSDRRVDDYLNCYAEDFKTPNGESRSEWAKTRKERIRRPSSIEVEVLNPKVKVEGSQATVSFKQSYRAGGNAMRTSKTLHLKQSGSKWLIIREEAAK